MPKSRGYPPGRRRLRPHHRWLAGVALAAHRTLPRRARASRLGTQGRRSRRARASLRSRCAIPVDPLHRACLRGRRGHQRRQPRRQLRQRPRRVGPLPDELVRNRGPWCGLKDLELATLSGSTGETIADFWSRSVGFQRLKPKPRSTVRISPAMRPGVKEPSLHEPAGPRYTCSIRAPRQSMQARSPSKLTRPLLHQQPLCDTRRDGLPPASCATAPERSTEASRRALHAVCISLMREGRRIRRRLHACRLRHLRGRRRLA